MKGPRSRHRYNVQRIWECSACQKRVFASARITSRICECQGKDRPTCMRLVEQPPRKRSQPSSAGEPPAA